MAKKEKQVTLRQQIEAWKSSKTFVGDLAQFFYFFDWFCDDKSLMNKCIDLMPKVIKFCEKKKIDLDKHYVIFKNNYPMFGKLYDDFRICDIKSHDVVWTVTPKVGYDKMNGEAELWGSENDFKGVILSKPNWKSLIESI